MKTSALPLLKAAVTAAHDKHCNVSILGRVSSILREKGSRGMQNYQKSICQVGKSRAFDIPKVLGPWTLLCVGCYSTYVRYLCNQNMVACNVLTVSVP